jgi:serine/threonine protein kinase
MSQEPLIGKTLKNRYRILEQLGRGGFGDTYLAEDWDLPNHPLCVVKHLKPRNPSQAVLVFARRLFNSEAQVLYRLGNEHDQIPRLFAHFEENSEFYLVQEFVDGHDLSKEIIRGKRLSENEVNKLLQDILEVLATVHQQNIIHRDIKPQNLMRRRKDGRIVLIDFGIVKEISALGINAQGQTSTTIAVGTPGYTPSEQLNGHPKLCSDIYAVGMVGIQALTGILPCQLQKDPDTLEVIWRIHAEVSDTLANILTKMVRYDFSQRYQTATAALQSLIAITSTQLSITLPPVPPSPQKYYVHKVVGVSFAAAMAFFVSIISISRQEPNPQSSSSPSIQTPSVVPTLQASQSQPIKVKISTVQKGILEDSSQFVANVESRRSTTLQSLFGGQISRIFVTPGDTVAEGDAIIQVKYATQQKQIQYYKVTAPFAGTVGDIAVKLGELVNTSTQLATITNNQPLELNILVPIERQSQLRKGIPVEVMDTQGKSLGMSRVFFISPSANNNTQSVLIKALYNNAKNQLRADQFARAKIIWSQRSGVLVPSKAVTWMSRETYVYVAQTQQSPQGESQLVARQKRVKTGNVKGNNYQVLEGLEPGERIILSGILNLRDGTPIIPEP